MSDILIKLKTEFNSIGSGNWEGINFNRRSFQISMFYRTFCLIYILKSSVLLHFCRSGLTDRRFSGSLRITAEMKVQADIITSITASQIR